MTNADKKLIDNGNKLAAQASLQLLPLIMNNIPQAVFWKDQNLVYLGCNRAFAEDAGFASPEEVIGKTDFDMPWKTQADLYRADDRHVLDRGEPKLNYEEPQTTPDGSTIWLRTSKIPVCENGQVVAILGMYEDITEHKQAELDLLLRDRALASSLNAVIILNFPDNKPIYANEALLKMTGYTFEEVKQLTLADITGNVAELPKIRSAVEKQGFFVGEELISRKDGSMFPATFFTSLIRDAKGQPIAVQSSFFDITEHKQAENLQQQNEHLFRALFEMSPDAVTLIDPYDPSNEWPIVDCNTAACRINGYTREELIGQPINIVNAPTNTPIDRDEYLKQLHEQITVKYEIPHRRKDGTIFPVEVSTTLIKVGERELLLGMDRDITERKRIEAELRNEQQRSQTILETIRVPTIISRLSDGIVLYANQAIAEVSRINLNKLIGFGTSNFYANPEDRNTVLEALRQYGHINDFEVQFRRTDGSTYWALLSSHIINYQGEACVLSSYVDITERKRAEEALRESEDRFRHFTEATSEALIFHEQGKIVDVNPAALVMFGFVKEADVIGRNLLEFIVPESHALVLQKMQLETVLPYEIQCIRTDRSTFPVETSTHGYKVGDRLIRATSVRDITERKQAEQALRENQQLLQLVMDNIPQAVFWKDRNLSYLGVNQSFAEDAGFASPQELVGKNDFDMPWEKQAELYRADDQRVLDLGETKLNYEEPQTGPTGDVTWLRTSKIPMRDTNGQIFAVLGMYEDITERKRLEAQIREALERRGLQVQLSTQISQSIAVASSLGELYERVVTQVKERLAYYHTQLLRYDPAQEAVVLVTGYGEIGAKMLAAGHHLPMGEGLIGTTAATGQTVLRPTLENDPAWRPNPLLPETKGEIAVPIKLGDTVLGVLDVQSNVAGALDADDQLLLEGLCGQIATAIESTRLRQEMAERLEEINRLYHAMSHEGWQSYRQTADVPSSFLYDQAGLRPAQAVDLTEELFANVPLTIPGGEVIGTLAVADDPQRPLSPEDENFLQQVSEQVALALESARLFEQTQSALVSVQQSQAALDEAMGIAKLANWEYDVNRDRFLFNDHFYSIFHTTAEQVGGYEISSAKYAELFVHPDDRPLVGQEIGKALSSTDRHYNTQLGHRILFADGGVGYISVNVHIERDEQGQIIRYYGANQDITERKLAEEAIAKRATELATVAQVSTTTSTMLDPDQLLQSVVDLTKERFGLYHVHIYLYEESWNTLMLAAGAGEVGRKLVAEQHAIPLSIEQSLVARAARERKAIIVNDVNNEPGFLPNPLLIETRAEIAVPMTVGDKLLGVFDVQSNNTAGFSNEDANIYVTLASQVGVALQNARLYVEQAALVTQLRELDRLKSSFLANMSHELRTPLNSILGFADVIIEELDGPLTENMSNDLRLIQKNGQHLLHLINDVLDMAKIEAGRMNLSPESFKVCEVMDEVTSITSTLASEKHLALFLEPDSDQQVSIYADRTRLRQVMINLVNNAIKFTENGKIAIKVVPLAGARVLISVKDTGIGIPPDKLEAVFQEFTQVDSSTTRKAGGTGLGLPISRRLVEMHGGRLWAESTGISGEGSTFFVELPVEARITETLEK